MRFLGEVEGFFYIGCQVDEVKLKDLLLHRYHQLDFIKDMRFAEFIDLVLLAMEEEKKEHFRQEYLALLPILIKAGKYMSFEQYYETASGRNIDLRPTEEIIAEIDAAHERLKNGT